jgi:hypothetical protein
MPLRQHSELEQDRFRLNHLASNAMSGLKRESCPWMEAPSVTISLYERNISASFVTAGWSAWRKEAEDKRPPSIQWGQNLDPDAKGEARQHNAEPLDPSGSEPSEARHGCDHANRHRLLAGYAQEIQGAAAKDPDRNSETDLSGCSW